MDNSDINKILDELIWILSDVERIKKREDKIDKLLNDERLFGDKTRTEKNKK